MDFVLDSLVYMRYVVG